MCYVLRLGLVVALTAFVAVDTNAQSDDRLIVPGQRIGNVSLGMSLAQLYAARGAPKKTLTIPSGDTQYVWDDVLVWVNAGAQTVSSAAALSPVYKTAEGIGVGSSDLEVRAKLGAPDCAPRRGSMLLYTNRQLTLGMEDGKVASVNLPAFRPRC
jgi:hypothetical protein